MSLRTHLTLRELGALCAMSKSQVHRIIADLTRRLAALMPVVGELDRRQTWIIDGTLVPTRDHSAAAKSKNYRWSCNAQVLVRANDLQVLAVSAGRARQPNDTIHYRGSPLETMCRSHPRVLADGGYRGITELMTPVFANNRRRRALVDTSVGFTIRFIIVHSSVALDIELRGGRCLSYVGREGNDDPRHDAKNPRALHRPVLLLMHEQSSSRSVR